MVLHPTKKVRFTAAYIALINIICLAGFLLLSQLISGRVCLKPVSFAVDNAGTVYIGQKSRILCIHSDGTTGEIAIAGYGDDYGLDIEGDALLIGFRNASEGKRVNLIDGSIEQVAIEPPLMPENDHYISESGAVYRLQDRLLRYRIERQSIGGEWQLVYEMDAHAFSIKAALLVVYAIFLPLLVLLALFSAWTQGYFDGKTHGKPFRLFVTIHPLPARNQGGDSTSTNRNERACP